MLLIYKNIEQFKYIIEYIHSFTKECNFNFKQDGLYIDTLDEHGVFLLNIYIDKKTFEKYECKKNEVIGVNINNLLNIFRINCYYDTFEMSTIYTDKLKIRFKSKKEQSKWVVNLLDINEDSLETHPFDSTHIILNASSFYKNLSNMELFIEMVTLQFLKNKFYIQGKYDKNETIITNHLDKKQIVSRKYNNIHLSFPINKLKNLCNLEKLSENIELYIAKNNPLKIYSKFNVMIGSILCYIAPNK